MVIPGNGNCVVDNHEKWCRFAEEGRKDMLILHCRCCDDEIEKGDYCYECEDQMNSLGAEDLTPEEMRLWNSAKVVCYCLIACALIILITSCNGGVEYAV